MKSVPALVGPLLLLAALALGGLLHAVGHHDAGQATWAAAAAVMLVPPLRGAIRSVRHGDVGVDVIALLAIGGALLVGEYLAAAVVALMLAGGGALEAYADGRARRELEALIAHAPLTATRIAASGAEIVAVEFLKAGDRLLVGRGEVVAVDGVIEGDSAVLDEAALTGEPIPVTYLDGASVRSGAVNAGDAFRVRATRTAEGSTFAGIVRLVREAELNPAPFTRLADRWALWFLGVTVALAGSAAVLSGDPRRAVAVLVVATPCPLILAAPIAFVAGLSRASRAGVIVKGAGALEGLARARTVLLDKTGTLTTGTPEVRAVMPVAGLSASEILRLAASVDLASGHVVARALVREAARQGIALTPPDGSRERPGEGAAGLIGNRRVAVGSDHYVRGEGHVGSAGAALLTDPDAAAARVLVGVDGSVVGRIVLGDDLRPDAAALVAQLREAGAARLVLLTGDRPASAQAAAKSLGLDEVLAEQTPADKLAAVRRFQLDDKSRPVVMVGDGVNDAPALAAADVGVAVRSSNATVAAETADAVIIDERIERLAEAMRIGRRSLRIATQAVAAGMGLSVIGMIAAALGYLPPVAGALFQEAIDVAVILYALRALRP